MEHPQLVHLPQPQAHLPQQFQDLRLTQTLTFLIPLHQQVQNSPFGQFHQNERLEEITPLNLIRPVVPNNMLTTRQPLHDPYLILIIGLMLLILTNQFLQSVLFAIVSVLH